jgi:hypothetical protein
MKLTESMGSREIELPAPEALSVFTVDTLSLTWLALSYHNRRRWTHW